MSEVEVDLPKAVVKRLIKARLCQVTGQPDKEYAINKEALLAFSESAKVFISFIASTANDICKEHKRQTMSAEDVFKALEEMEFGDMVAPLRQQLKEHKESKATAKANSDKKRKASAQAGTEKAQTAGKGEEADDGAEDAAAEGGEECSGNDEQPDDNGDAEDKEMADAD